MKTVANNNGNGQCKLLQLLLAGWCTFSEHMQRQLAFNYIQERKKEEGNMISAFVFV
jgi:hypothetical protein